MQTRKPSWISLWATSLLLLVGGLGSEAQIANTLSSIQVTNPSPWVIDSDASNPAPGWNRDGLSVEIDVRSANSAAVSLPVAYTMVFRLLDESGGVHPLFQADGTTNQAYTYFLVQNSFQLGAGQVTMRSHSAFLKPAARLSSLTRYRVEARVFRPGVANADDTRLSSLRTYYHFVNVVSSDQPLNAIVIADSVTLVRRGALAADPQHAGFEARVNYTIRRYDAYNGSHLPADDVPVRFTYELQEAGTGTVIPIALGTTNALVGVFRHAAALGGTPLEPAVSAQSQVLTLTPTNPNTLDSVNKTYRVVVRISHQEFPNLPLYRVSNEEQTGAERLLHFNGRLFFGTVETRFNQLANSPAVLSLSPGAHVRTTLDIGAGAGHLVSQPTWTFGGGAPFIVRLLPNGDAQFDDTSVPLGVQPPLVKVNNVRVSYSGTVLTQNGLVAAVKAWLPAGFGYRLDTNTHVLRNSITWPIVAITPAGVPTVASLSYTPTGGLQAAEESQPLWFPAKSITWRIGAGRFEVGTLTSAPEHVRADEYDRLVAVRPSLVEVEAATKRSNDGYFDFVDSATPPTVEADADCIGRLTTSLTFRRGSFRTHFPWDSRVQWNGGGQNEVVSGTAPSLDELTQVASVAVSYSRGCLEGDCPGDAQMASVAMEPTNSVLRFTRDGGLAAVGRTTQNLRLQIGYIPSLDQYTHEVFTFTEAGFHMPGRILRGELSQLPPDQRAGALLYAGVLAQDPKQPQTEERRDVKDSPFQVRYLKGLADYAGLNLRLHQDAAANGRSILGGSITPIYPLQKNSKYYLRQGGVSGVHQALSGGFPPEMEIYGYDFEFTHFAFNLLDNAMLRSEINGTIHVPYPSQFDQEFSGLEFDCLGALTGVDVLEGSLVKPLEYWNGQFNARSLNFQRNPDQQCDPSVGRLVMGIDTAVANVQERLAGTLGFLPDGNLISATDGLEGVNSRLSLPTLVHVPGPVGETYLVTPVTAAYFNDYRQRSAQPLDEPGWVNFAGKIDVSFFSDLEVHFQTSANAAQPEAYLGMMGGWVADPEEEGNHGWTTAGDHYFFNDVGFDPSNRGYPETVSLVEYREPASSESFRVRAKRRWQNIHTFEFPLDYLRSLRAFRSPQPIKREMIVLETERQVERLTPKHTELTFGAQIEVAPAANFANIAAQIADHTGISAALAEAIGITERDALVGGFTSMDELLNSSMETFFDTIFDESIQPAVAKFYQDLSGLYAGFDADNPLVWQADLNDYAVNQLAPRIEKELKELGGDLDKGIIHGLQGYLDKGRKGIGQAARIVSKVSDKRTNIVKSVTKIVEFLSPQHQNSLVPERIDALLTKAEPTFQQLEDGCLRLSNVVSQISAHMLDLGTLQNPGGLGIEVKEVIGKGTNEIRSLSMSVANSIQGLLNEIVEDGDSPFQDYAATDMKLRFRQAIMDRWLGSATAADIRQVLKERLYENDAAAREILDSIFSEINRIIRGLVKLSASGAASQFQEMLDDVGRNVLTADVDGYAHINGDSLKELRLDAKVQMGLTKPLEFGAYLRILELDSEGTKTCNEDLVGATEVTLGAKDVPIGWIKSGLKASVENKFTFGGLNGGGLRGLAGGFQLVGEIDLEDLTIEKLAGAVAFGRDENYLSGGADMKISGWKMGGGVFVGRTCSLKPIEIWDPKAAGALGTGTFTGLYAYGEGWVPLNEIFGIKSSCLFTLAGGMGIGRGFFLEGPTVIAKLKYGLSGEFLCLVHLKGELTGVASLKLFNPLEGAGDDGYVSGLLDKVRDGLTLRAFGKFTGSLGPCPLCLEYSKEIGATYKGGKWKLEK